jgi:hypothetical protein
MTGKNFRLILLAAYVSASLFRCAADCRPRRREVAARLPVTGALDRPLLVLPFLGCTCTFSAVGVEPTVNVTPANVAVWRPVLRPALSTATSPCFATESVASMASKCSWSERAATSEGAPAMGKRPNMETLQAVRRRTPAASCHLARPLRVAQTPSPGPPGAKIRQKWNILSYLRLDSIL